MPARRSGGWQQPDSSGGVGPVVQRIRAEVEELAEAYTAIPPRITDLDNRLREIGMAMRDVERQVGEQDTAVHDLTALVKRLGARVEWLERNIRLTDSAEEADLDEVGPEETRLAEVAEQGHRAQAGLLAGSSRSGLESAVQAHQDAVQSHARHRDQALDACRDLAHLPWTDPRHRQAAERFQQERADAERTRASIQDLAGPALQAAQQLAVDEERHREVADVVGRGERAWATLNGLLRSRLAEAVGSGNLLPAWFTAVLGPIPPMQDARRWMDAGTALLAYRVTYGITDPVLPLGPPPGAGSGPRRSSWHDQLTRQFRELQG